MWAQDAHKQKATRLGGFHFADQLVDLAAVFVVARAGFEPTTFGL